MDFILSRLKKANPWLHFSFAILLATSLLCISISLWFQSTWSKENLTLATQKLEESNIKRHEKVLEVQSKSKSLEQMLPLILKGLIESDQAAPDLTALENIGIRPLPSFADELSAHFILRSNDLEYHAFAPALSLQEKSTPLMRCSRLTLRTTHKPFHSSAIPLRIELEVVFPKTSKTAEPEQKPPENPPR